jgi:predicted ribosomally synthesized peptide with SipW-like signal peptide
MNENNNKSNTLLLTVIAIATLLVAVIGATFAYFTANTKGTESASTLNVGAATLSIVFEDGDNSVVTADKNIEPSTTALITKNFTLTGKNTTMYMPYTLNLVVTTNTFELENQITGTSISYRLIANNSEEGIIPSTANGTYVSVANIDELSEITVDSSDSAVKGIEIGNGYFASTDSTTHNYTLEIYFMEDGTNQDTDKSKTFTAYIDCSTKSKQLTSEKPTPSSTAGYTTTTTAAD